MKQPRFYVDFNELIESDLVALSASDEKLSSTGEKISLQDGLLIDVYSDDLNDKGELDSLIASGVVERNSALGWAEKIRWCCRIDALGIRHQSETDR
jgi:addiction module HigA family antidote